MINVYFSLMLQCKGRRVEWLIFQNHSGSSVPSILFHLSIDYANVAAWPELGLCTSVFQLLKGGGSRSGKQIMSS